VKPNSIDASGGLFFLPLGGSGEIGMNLNLYRCDGQWLMVDCGITFGGDQHPGVEVILPDPTFIEKRRERLLALVITHAHEDHLGAVPYLWPRFRCPVYATPFAANVLRRKLAEIGLLGEVPLHVLPLSGQIEIGPFDIELIGLTHSIPEPNALAIRTPYGTVLHTGDWKIDPEPLVGLTTDRAALDRAGNEGVLALIGDSTNAMIAGHSGSEAAVRKSLVELISRQKRRVAVGCFASNVARLSSLAFAAVETGRRLAFVGRSLWRIYEAAYETGYLTDIEPPLSEHDVGYLPREEVLLACTGSQGEPRAAFTRIASGTHPHVTLERGDTAIFSSRIIPGNERAIGALHNKLAGLGVGVVTDAEHFVHVSGHPARDELVQMYQWTRPKIAIPVHGEARHMAAHGALARDCQVPEVVIVTNGKLVRLAPGPAEIVGEEEFGRLALDGKRLLPLEGALIRERHRMLFTGAVLVSLVLDRKGALRAEPQVSAPGMIASDKEGPAAEFLACAAAVREALEELSPFERQQDSEVRDIARRAVRRFVHEHYGKKPLAEIHLIRI
jgi:ribonuclease J